MAITSTSSTTTTTTTTTTATFGRAVMTGVVAALAARMSDTNKNLITLALDVAAQCLSLLNLHMTRSLPPNPNPNPNPEREPELTPHTGCSSTARSHGSRVKVSDLRVDWSAWARGAVVALGDKKVQVTQAAARLVVALCVEAGAWTTVTGELRTGT